jgi:hypothetical protein
MISPGTFAIAYCRFEAKAPQEASPDTRQRMDLAAVP